MMFFSSIAFGYIRNILDTNLGTYKMLYLALCGNLPLHQIYQSCLI